ncbi:MAG: SDR family NAD(P)-dependent oxidoreductase, partial [Cyclobacteriaceae bacterium]
LQKIDAVSKGKFSFKREGVYLITGGSGGLGKVFSTYLSAKYGSKVISCGRRSFESTDIKDSNLYFTCDLNSRTETEKMITSIVANHGRLDGVIHAAGVSLDSLMINKNEADILKVLSPKINGTKNLDDATKDLELDCFILFSSNASITSNIGQTDYSAANTFMDFFADDRTNKVDNGQRSGRTISISWPLWRNGGMQFGREVENHLFDKWGMMPLPTEIGIDLFESAISANHHHYFALYGDIEKFDNAYSPASSKRQGASQLSSDISPEDVMLRLKEIVSDLLKLDIADIPVYESFGNLGFDSIVLKKFSTVLMDDFAIDITPMAFYNYPSIEELADHLLENYKIELQQVLAPMQIVDNAVGSKPVVPVQQVVTLISEIVSTILKLDMADIPLDESFGNLGFDSITLKKFATMLENQYQIDVTPMVFYTYQDIESLSQHLLEEYSEQLQKDLAIESSADVQNGLSNSIFESIKSVGENRISRSDENYENEPIAIVGMSGRFPQSPDLDSFWKNLEANRDLITEIPKNRWNWEDYYGDSSADPTKTKVKWGGFIEDVDKFDPFFFNLSPREAEVMDPQHRIALEAVYHALEDAGIVPETLAGTSAGIFMGSYFDDYFSIVNEAGQYQEAQSLAGLSQSMLVNRISYLLDIHGPSEPVDTACSSSLVAIHKAVDHLRKGQCDVVMAGGVSLDLKPYLFLTLTQAGMLSEDGRCKTFDDSANGYARGEGVGVIVLKTLSKAKEDGDRIYGLVRGTAENHGGKANTLTSPNPNAQKNLLIEAYENAGVDPTKVTYIEAHGTGTPLGDPIETEGLKSAFSELFDRKAITPPAEPYCSLGSVKTNTGHLEAAAGIIGVIKVLLSMQHEILPGNPQLKKPNQYLKLDNSPFYLQKETTRWNAAEGSSLIAGVSSFGFGGTNAHVVLESYTDPKIKRLSSNSATQHVFVLSARNKERLKDYAVSMADYLERHEELAATDIAYTSQTGRSAMEERLAVVFDSTSTLIKQLRDFTDEVNNAVATGNSKQYQDTSGSYVIPYGKKQFSNLDKSELERLAKAWVNGTPIDWSTFYDKEEKPTIVSLPGYPFARESYWVAEVSNNVGTNRKLHPLLHENISDLYGQKFNTEFTGAESYLRDHVINGKKILPGVSYIEMVREAGERSIGKKITTIKEVTWVKPVIVDDKVSLQVEIYPYEDHLTYKVVSGTESDKVIHGEGDLLTNVLSDAESQDLRDNISHLDQEITGDEFYRNLSLNGFDYGTSFRGIRKIYYNKAEAVAEIVLEASPDYQLAPGILDSALHPSLLLAGNDDLLLPYHIGQLRIYAPLKGKIVSHVRKITSDLSKEMNEFDVTITDETGTVLVKIDRFIALPQKIDTAKARVYEVNWIESAIVADRQPTKKVILVADGPESLVSNLKIDSSVETGSLSTRDKTQILIDLTAKVKELTTQKQELTFYLVYQNDQRVDVSYLSGFFRSMNLENPSFSGKLIGVDGFDAIDITETIEAESRSVADDIRYKGGVRSEIQTIKTALPPEYTTGSFKPGGVYLVTGGAGAIGRSLIRKILTFQDTQVIATGRKATADLSEFGSDRVSYHVCDVADAAKVDQLIGDIKKTYGKLDGIIHSAGVIKDDFIINKTGEQIEQVLKPKLAGTINLDEATKNERLDFFIGMASLSGFGGNIGQSDYASANAFLDEYLRQRAIKVASGQRHGLSISLDWSLWKDGGMKIDRSSEKYLEDTWGIIPFPNEKAVTTMEAILSMGKSGQYVVTYGNREFERRSATSHNSENVQVIESMVIDENWQRNSEALIKSLLAEELRMSPERMQADVPFENYGIDSILINKITNKLDAEFGRLPRTLFFEYQTLGELTEYFLEEHADTLQQKFSTNSVKEESAEEPVIKLRLPDTATAPVALASAPAETHEEIAIVGLSGRYPGADNLEEFWENLKQGKDSITEIPADRWDIATMYDADPGAKGKISSKWGGFINDVDKFDPVFFKISPREAEALDPQERLFLQTAWSAVEDAGYTRKTLHNDKTREELGGKVGVFVGVMYEEYQLFGAEQTLLGNSMALWGSPSSIANRVSYFFDLHGPSMAVDTMCSSSITAIHLA